MIHAYTDDESHGCAIIAAGKSPLFWRAGKQNAVSLSTAELNEVIEGMTAGESVGVMMEEILGPLPHMAWTDSQSGLAIIASEGGSWRSRHLRTKQQHLPDRQSMMEPGP